ncbi:hypothetical protein FDP41_013463 [Naegleria fowleri]|uniref:Uncharacterized protein n=1 Tax=Naegleria fowleri TaxID=5763 RepID=A0A6A5C4J1_NAEFO|nr:uncharacterized protein FDP41_013463 [Naegleria fowleri]KAF0980249.1 hypothetical protein FDP41_013463 [Naegleria fowleri]CAG4718202.1 unnamed protein product [Naegleria fowleri]
MCSVLLLSSSTNAQSTQLVITVNRIVLFNGDAVTITSNELQSTLNGVPSPPRIIYNVLSISNGQFQVSNGNNTFTPVTQFTQNQVNLGLVRFVHANNLQIPSYTLNAFDPVLGITSAPSQAVVTFTAFNRDVIGAPRPVFDASVDPSTLIVTLSITMFKLGGVFNTSDTGSSVNFNIGLSSKYTCLSNDLIRDGFALTTSTSWYNTYQLRLSLNDFIANPNVQWVSNGGVVDLVAVMFADYMIHLSQVPGTTAISQKSCYEVIFTQRYILTLTLAVTRINFGTQQPNIFMKPKRIFVNDLNRLEIRLEVSTTVSQNISSWFVSGPQVFTVTDAIFTGVVNGTFVYQIVMQSNVITGQTNFFGDYTLSFRTVQQNTFSIPYTLQYLVPFPPIQEELIFNTSAQTFGDARFTQPQNQFSPTDTIFVRVEAPDIPVIPGQTIIPFNVIMCCFASIQTIPAVVDCRNSTRSDFSNNIFVMGQAVRAGGINAQVDFSANTTYGFNFGLPFAIRDNVERCFLTIESAYSSRNNLRKLEETKASTVQSLTYRVLDIVKSGKKTGITNSGNSHHDQLSFVLVALELLSFALLWFGAILI